MMADVAGSAVGFCIYAIVILHRILGRNENPFVQAFAGIFCIAVLFYLVCLFDGDYFQSPYFKQGKYFSR